MGGCKRKTFLKNAGVPTFLGVTSSFLNLRLIKSYFGSERQNKETKRRVVWV
ncbi:hypothetical protein LEP1GSC060_0700 [Leptospira weilii serovar Ranarum str. ICFT]|uniref:Uncharacterized protein n=1 Tax=Leptospira weilii serovar Ranarum str. ICFT TaxID=1218598 RepID=N1WM33_9LEPT|nr:hypothetical protein LEP1GSC060_0700 [Leptospira weilii serovar Ranarum str. ICFT]